LKLLLQILSQPETSSRRYNVYHLLDKYYKSCKS